MGKSLQKKLTLFVVGLLLALAALLSLVSYQQMRSQLLVGVKSESEAAANGYSRLIAEWVASKRSIVNSMAPIAEKPDAVTYFQRASEGGGFDLVYAGYADKRAIFSSPQELPPGWDPTGRPWYKMAAEVGGSVLTEPYTDTSSGKLVVSFATPVKGGGGVTAVVAGDISIDRLVKDVLALKLAGNGYAMLLSKDGKIIAHPDAKLTLKGVGDLSSELATHVAELGQPSKGLVDAAVGGKSSLVLWQPVAGSDWTLALVMERSAVLAPLKSLLFKVLGIIAVFGIGVSLLAVATLSRMLKGLGQIRNAMQEIAGGEGDLTRRIDVQGDDEVGQTAEAFNRFLGGLQGTIKEVTQASLSVASGATELSASAEQMSATTQEIAKSGELLHGATETVASAITEFMASVEEVARNVKTSVEHTGQTVEATEAGSEGTKVTAEGMSRIREVSAQISSAVLVIQEIARQTNLLSLNAAIEAAKAGEQGKGFAVVAEEVRKLADRSRQAAVEIGKMLQDAQMAVDGGVSSVQNISELMERIQISIKRVSALINEIGTATREQTSTASEIAKRMEESAREIGQNAVASQELSATVHEISRTASDLAHIANNLAQAMARFKV
jgi:methyl-accepting chemotaxis protein